MSVWCIHELAVQRVQPVAVCECVYADECVCDWRVRSEHAAWDDLWSVVQPRECAGVLWDCERECEVRLWDVCRNVRRVCAVCVSDAVRASRI